jgi:hypothetical protein
MKSSIEVIDDHIDSAGFRSAFSNHRAKPALRLPTAETRHPNSGLEAAKSLNHVRLAAELGQLGHQLIGNFAGLIEAASLANLIAARVCSLFTMISAGCSASPVWTRRIFARSSASDPPRQSGKCGFGDSA